MARLTQTATANNMTIDAAYYTDICGIPLKADGTGVINDDRTEDLTVALQVGNGSHVLPGGTAVNRSYGHAWDYARCRATQQVIEPQSTTLRVTTDLAYDAYGNVSSRKVTPVGQPVRTTTLTWTQNGRFPDNSLGDGDKNTFLAPGGKALLRRTRLSGGG